MTIRHIEVAYSDTMASLIKIRKDAGITQQEVADIMGITASAVSALERPGRAVRPEVLTRYADAIGVDIVVGIDF